MKKQPKPSLTTQTHQIINQYLSSGDIAIDATLGNGHDTLFLAKKVGLKGCIYGFDKQYQAIESTRLKLDNEGLTNQVVLNHTSHNKITNYIPQQFHKKIKVIMFNLGYLPGGDKSIITEVDSTLSALQQSLSLLCPNGIITVIAYPGHQGGDIETQQIDHWCQQLNPQNYNYQTLLSSEKITAPRLFVVNKLDT